MKILKMQLFGTFYLTDGFVTLTEESIQSRKLTAFLIYILVHRDSVLTHQNLIEQFWGTQSKNPESALKNQIYQLRNILKIFGNETYIRTVPGAYQWNPEIKVETDYEQFENAVTMLQSSENDRKKKKELCREIAYGFPDDLTDQISQEKWATAKRIWYRSSYMNAVRNLCEILEEEKNWNELERICRMVRKKDNQDEDIICWLITGLLGQNKEEEVSALYEEIGTQFQNGKRVQCSERMQNLYQYRIGNKEESLKNIKNSLDEPKEIRGAYICDFQTLKKIYQVEARRINRIGIAEYAMLFTLERIRKRKKDDIEDRLMEEGMQKLEAVIRRNLRSSDVAARYNSNQYIVLLPVCTYESSLSVADRVAVDFQKQYKRKKLEIYYEVAEIMATE